jgi:ABC-type sugar transport system substrate-binding protein
MSRKRGGQAIAGIAVLTVTLLVIGSAVAKPNKHTKASASPVPVFVGTYPGIDPAEEQLKVGAKAAAKALKVKLSWLTPTTFDVSQQRQITESALSLKNLKGLSVVAADPNSLEGVMREAKKKGIAISQLSACNPKQVAPVCYSTDFYKAGVAVAERMAKLMNNTGDVVIATGVPGDVNHQLRVKGFTTYMKAHAPKIKIVQTIPNCDNADQTTQCAETALSGHPNLAGYYATGGDAANGAATVFPRANKKVVVAAVDDNPTTIGGIKSGSISFTYVQQLYCGGYLMVLLPYEMAFKGLVPTKKFVDTGIAFVDKSNVNTYKQQVGPNCTKLVRYVNTVVMKKKS